MKSFKSLLFVIVFITTTHISSAATQTFFSSGNFIVPAGVTSISAFLAAGGGGGGGSDVGKTGGGGGSGGYHEAGPISVSPGQNMPIIVGRGGFAGSLKNGQTIICSGSSPWGRDGEAGQASYIYFGPGQSDYYVAIGGGLGYGSHANFNGTSYLGWGGNGGWPSGTAGSWGNYQIQSDGNASKGGISSYPSHAFIGATNGGNGSGYYGAYSCPTNGAAGYVKITYIVSTPPPSVNIWFSYLQKIKSKTIDFLKNV